MIFSVEKVAGTFSTEQCGLGCWNLFHIRPNRKKKGPSIAGGSLLNRLLNRLIIARGYFKMRFSMSADGANLGGFLANDDMAAHVAFPYLLAVA